MRNTASLYWAGSWMAASALPLAAQPLPTPHAAMVAQWRALDRVQAEQERRARLADAQQPGYRDRVMSENEPEQAPAEPEAPGWRAWQVESRWGRQDQQLDGAARWRSGEWGLRSELRWDTQDHGEWQLQADTRDGAQGSGATSPFALAAREAQGLRITLRNLGLPLAGDRFLDSAVGDLLSENTDALGRGQRLLLGAGVVRGAGLRMFSPVSDLRLGMGRRGVWAGGPYPGFESSGGSLAWLGYTQRAGTLPYFGAQWQHATEVPWIDASSSRRLASTSSVAAAVGRGDGLWRDGDRSWRLALLGSRSRLDDGQHKNGHGLVLEGGMWLGRFRHEAALYTTTPQLRFGDQWLADGQRGLLWRVDHLGTRLAWGLGLEHERQSEAAWGGGATRHSLNAHWQQTLGRHRQWGGYLNLGHQRRDGAADRVASAYATVYGQTRWSDWGPSRLRLNVRRNETLVANGPRATGEEVVWEQDWLARLPTTAQGSEWRTSLGLARDRSVGQAQTQPTAGVSWTGWLRPDWSVGAQLRYSARDGNLSTSQGLAGHLRTEARLGEGWTLGAELLLNQAVVRLGGGPVLGNTAGASVLRSRDRSFWLTVRYEGQRGQPYSGPALPGLPRAGTGRIVGTVFLDANRDGESQADEPGVPGVEVVLNQRLRTLTDAQGRFEFAGVAVGVQRLSVRAETVPLPWGSGRHSQREVEVPLRGVVSAPLAVVHGND